MKSDTLEKSFQIHIPVELVKSSDSSNSGEESENDWKIGGIASTEDIDLQGEEILQDGLDITVLKAGRGLFNNNHSNNPEDILGEIEDAEFIDHKGKPALVVKGYLFKHQDRAKAYYNIMKSVKKGRSPRVHFSIEGKVVERDMANTAKIRKARVTKVALTLDPVNTNTFANLMKSLQTENKLAEQEFLFNDILNQIREVIDLKVKKAISAGAGYAGAPSSRTGGSAMSTESLDKKTKKITYKSRKQAKPSSYMLKSLIDIISSMYEGTDPIEIAEVICKTYKNKAKE